MKKNKIFFIVFFIIGLVFGHFILAKKIKKIPGMLDLFFQHKISIEKYNTDNKIEKEAIKQFGIVTKYDFSQGYYDGGRPKDPTVGVCTDVVVDALKNLGYDLQEKIYNDIKKRPEKYHEKPDKNISQRRAKNLKIFFDKYEKSLPLDTKENLNTWKGGDIVIWKNHIGIISSIKRDDGLPYVISNHGTGTILADILDNWSAERIGHYRIISLEK